MGLGNNAFGLNTSSDAVSYSIASVAQSGLIQSSKFVDIAAKVNAERGRRGAGAQSYNTSGLISASDLNAMKAGLEVAPLALGTGGYYDNKGYQTHATYDYDNGTGQGSSFPGAADTGNSSSGNVTWSYGTASFPQASAYTAGFSGVAQNSLIYAQNINDMITKITNAGAVCMCNCNYCTCNCNYCTCNCNYACTCNCNYSDERLKENIKLIGNQEGLNVYSFTYLWDKSTTYTGVMAQQLVGTKYASALGTDKNGYYYVDYSQLPIIFEEV
jgi:Chaperone of endosialidase